jgi:hypothetical protein
MVNETQEKLNIPWTLLDKFADQIGLQPISELEGSPQKKIAFAIEILAYKVAEIEKKRRLN